MSSEFLSVLPMGNRSHFGWSHPTSLLPNQEASNTWFINRQASLQKWWVDQSSPTKLSIEIWNMYLCIKHELFSAASTPTQPDAPPFHWPKHKCFSSAKGPAKDSEPANSVQMFMAKAVCSSFLWLDGFVFLVVLHLEIEDLVDVDLFGYWKWYRVLAYERNSQNQWITHCDELEGPLTPVPGSLHQGKDPMCWNCTFFFRKFWGRVPLKLDHISGEVRKWSIHKVEIKHHQPEINLKW